MSSSNGSSTSLPSGSGTTGVDGSIHHGNDPHEDEGYQSDTESDGGDSGSEANQTTGILESKSEALFFASVSELKAEQDCGSLRTTPEPFEVRRTGDIIEVHFLEAGGVVKFTLSDTTDTQHTFEAHTNFPDHLKNDSRYMETALKIAAELAFDHEN
jgi:hypothetical protein